jgi:hypothetical protein
MRALIAICAICASNGRGIGGSHRRLSEGQINVNHCRQENYPCKKLRIDVVVKSVTFG